MTMYPSEWPQCPVCGEPSMDDHITCGSVFCDEQKQRVALDQERMAAAEAEMLETHLPGTKHGPKL